MINIIIVVSLDDTHVTKHLAASPLPTSPEPLVVPAMSCESSKGCVILPKKNGSQEIRHL